MPQHPTQRGKLLAGPYPHRDEAWAEAEQFRQIFIDYRLCRRVGVSPHGRGYAVFAYDAEQPPARPSIAVAVA